jgi:hypothetical protein
LHKMLWNFWKIGQWMKMGFRWKNQTIYKIHESSKVESKFPAFWIHLLFIFLASIYCPALTCPSIVCSPKFICLLSSSVLSNVSLSWVHPLFHFTKFNCSLTSAKLSQVHSLFHFLKSIVCPIILDCSFWISFFQLPSWASIVQLPLINLLSNFFN